ncbi:hypothetical protein KFU94_03470 [Chloroflexi bacterium TSY]|nr:hypothetical protein [Chloroflexi bacterium TSY]
MSQITFSFNCSWIVLLPFLLTVTLFTACNTTVSKGRAQIRPERMLTDMKPETDHSFTFVVTDRETKQPVPDSLVLVTLGFPNDEVHEIFRGQTNAEGKVDFAYKTPSRKYAAEVTFAVQAQTQFGEATFRQKLTLLPPLQIEIEKSVQQVAPGSQAEIVVRVVDILRAEPASDVDLFASLKLKDDQEFPLFQGRTDVDGRVTFMLRTPFDLSKGAATLELVAHAAIGQIRESQPLKVVPPVTIEPMRMPNQIVAGQAIDYTFRVMDNVNVEPAAFSDVQVYLSGAGYTSGWSRAEQMLQADAEGLVTLQLKPKANNVETRLHLNLYAEAFEGTASHRQTITVVPPLSISLLGTSRQAAPGSQTTVQVRVWDNMTDQPAVDADVRLGLVGSGLKQASPIRGRTDEAGLVRLDFTIPNIDTRSNRGNPYLDLQVRASVGKATSELHHRMSVFHQLNTLLTTDKPVYQPGQTIQVRALVLDGITNRPASGEQVAVRVYDPRGNTLSEEKRRTSEFGIVSTELELDAEAASGHYRIQASVSGGRGHSRTVEVKPYTLPRFEIDIQGDAAHYLPGATATAVLSATYFFGKPVANGEVIIRGYAPTLINSEQEEQVLLVQGRTDERGKFAYTFELPDTFRNRLANKTTQVRLEIDVTDASNHLERTESEIILAEQPLLLEVVAESGVLKPGIENIVYIQASRPNGQPAQVPLVVYLGDLGRSNNTKENVRGEIAPIQVETNSFGLGSFSFVPQGTIKEQLLIEYEARNLSVEGQAQIETHQMHFELEVQTGSGQALLLRPAQAQIAMGEILKLDLFTSGLEAERSSTTAYIELKKADQTVLLVPVPLEKGVGQAEIQLDPSLVGTIRVSAHLYLDKNRQVSDHRLLLIHPSPLDLDVTLDKADSVDPNFRF